MLKYNEEILEHFEKGPIHKASYDNGAVFLHHRVSGMRGASLYVWFHGGSRVETKEKQGIAHLLEHMIFRGSLVDAGKEKIINRLESLGAELNAYTTKEYIQFDLGVLVSKMPDVFPLFLDMILGPAFLEEGFEKEKEIVIKEIKEDLDDFEMLAEEKLFEKAYSFPLGHSIGGTVGSVRKLTLKDCKNYFKKNLTAPKMVVSMVADDESEFYITELAKKFTKYGLTKKAMPFRPKLSKGLTKPISFESKLSRSCQMATVILSTVGSPMESEYRGDFIVLDHYLSEGMSSLLFKTLREDMGLVYGVSSSTTSFTDKGSFEISAVCDKKAIPEVIKTCKALIEVIANEGVSKKELEKTKRQILDCWDMSFDDIDERNTHIGGGELYRGRVFSIKEINEVIEKVTGERVQYICKKINSFGFSKVIVYPK